MTGPLGLLAARRAREARLQGEADAIAARHEGARRTDGAPALPVVLVPANTRALVALPEVAQAGFRVHLDGVMADAFARPLRDNALAMTAQEAGERADAGETASRDPGLPAHMVLGSCATCRGSCCTAGGTRAFLTADSLVRVRAQRVTLGVPGESPDAIAALYLDRLPAVHYEGSCVFHARTGCALPRGLRANLCNRYQCGELTQLSRALGETGAASAYVGAASGERLERMALVGAAGVAAIAMDGGAVDA